MFSLPKLIVLILLVVGGWILYSAIKRRGVSGLFKAKDETGPGPASAPKSLDMEKCRICGDFVPPDARACAEARCPYPAR